MSYENITGTPALTQLKGPSTTEPVLATTFVTNVLQPIANHLAKLEGYVLIQDQQVTRSGGISSGSITSATPLAIANSDVDLLVQAGDIVRYTIGPLRMFGLGEDAYAFSLVIRLIEDVSGAATPVTDKLVTINNAAIPGGTSVTIPLTYQAQASGTLRLRLLVQSDGTHSGQASSICDDWCTVQLIGDAR